jgi:hypothetical protein
MNKRLIIKAVLMKSCAKNNNFRLIHRLTP